jgi:hypothetical protein
MKNDLEGSVNEIVPVLALAPEFRMATITGYTAEIDKRLQQRRFQGNAMAMEIGQQVKHFNFQRSQLFGRLARMIEPFAHTDGQPLGVSC